MVKQKKKNIRKQILELRNSLSEDEIIEKSFAICDNFFDLPEVVEAKTFFVYASVQSEVNTTCIIERLLNEGKVVALPRIEELNTPMALHTIDSLNNLENGPFNIPEPSSTDPVISENEIQIAILPGIAFDEFGWRLGWGGGFYDRFLSKSNALSVGLAFELQMVNSLPTELHDKQVNYIITEKRVMATNLA